MVTRQDGVGHVVMVASASPGLAWSVVAPAGAGGVDRVPIRSPLRTLAALIRARWVNACGKLPTCRPRATSYSSAYGLRSLRSLCPAPCRGRRATVTCEATKHSLPITSLPPQAVEMVS